MRAMHSSVTRGGSHSDVVLAAGNSVSRGSSVGTKSQLGAPSRAVESGARHENLVGSSAGSGKIGAQVGAGDRRDADTATVQASMRAVDVVDGWLQEGHLDVIASASGSVTASVSDDTKGLSGEDIVAKVGGDNVNRGGSGASRRVDLAEVDSKASANTTTQEAGLGAIGGRVVQSSDQVIETALNGGVNLDIGVRVHGIHGNLCAQLEAVALRVVLCVGTNASVGNALAIVLAEATARGTRGSGAGVTTNSSNSTLGVDQGELSHAALNGVDAHVADRTSRSLLAGG